MANKGFYQPGPGAIEWETPPALFDALWDEFGGFDYDPCCRVGQYTARRVLDAGGTICVPPDRRRSLHVRVLRDGLAQAWRGKVFMNPPYARGELPKWVGWGAAQASRGQAELVVALLPVRTDTIWWQTFVLREAWADLPGNNGAGPATRSLGFGPSTHYLVRFLPGRQTFVGANNQARFASAVVVWRK